jgi:hypothetical protein
VGVDLDRQRTLGELVGLTFELFRRHPATFLSLTLLVVAPIVIVTAGYVLLEAVLFSLTAIFGTLLFFDSRARTALPWQGTSRVDPSAPERPILPPRI